MAKKQPQCKWCDQGHGVKKDGSHWIVKSIIPARLTIVACKKAAAVDNTQIVCYDFAQDGEFYHVYVGEDRP